MAFPDNVQNFMRAIDPSTVTDAQNIEQYQQYIENGNFTAAQNLLAEIQNGSAMNLNAGRFNEILQTVEDIQNFYFGLNGVQDYIDSNINIYSDIAMYSSQTNYVVGNIVSSGSEYYRCIQENGPNTSVHHPSESDSQYWELFLAPQEPKQYPIQAQQPTGQQVGDLWFQVVSD